MADLVATAELDIDAPPVVVWDALTDPVQIKRYMFGSVVETDWKPGSEIVWRGEYEGRTYEDKGRVLAVEPGHRLVVTHFSPLSGNEDIPANYHTLTYLLEKDGAKMHLSLSHDQNASEAEVIHSRQNWEAMLGQLKNVVEGG